MKYKTFVINLDRSINRWEKFQKVMQDYPAEYERVSAVDGQTLSQQEIDAVYHPNHLFERLMGPNEVACYLSHIHCWQKIIDEKLDYAIILEDDALPAYELETVHEAIGQLDISWDCLKLSNSFNPKPWALHVDLEFLKVVSYRKIPTQAIAQAISWKGAKKLLETRIPFHRPVDVDLQFFWENELEIYGLMPYPFSNGNYESDIAPRGKRRRKNLSEKWSHLKRRIEWNYKSNVDFYRRNGLVKTYKSQSQWK